MGKEKEAENRGSIKDVLKSISYFVAGTTLIWTILSLKSTGGVIEPMGWFTCAVGAFLVVAGVISLIIIPFSKGVPAKLNFFKSQSNYLNAMVFAVALITLTARVLGFRGYTSLYILGIVFLFAVMLMVIITSWRKVFGNVLSLLTFTLSLNALGITILFINGSNIELATLLGLSFLSILFALNKIQKGATS
ncbi:MAG: hypothetical protein ACOC6R_01495 [Chloroflexota bacterium]